MPRVALPGSPADAAGSISAYPWALICNYTTGRILPGATPARGPSPVSAPWFIGLLITDDGPFRSIASVCASAHVHRHLGVDSEAVAQRDPG